MPRYTLLQRLLHWAMALIILGVLGVGLIFAVLAFSGTKAAFGGDVTNLLYKYHKTFGVIVLILMIVRLIVRVDMPPPDYEPPLSPFERRASRAVHLALYLTLFLMPVLGWLATGASGYPVEFFTWTLPPILGKDKALGSLLFEMHGILGWVLLVLLVAHIGAAIRHALLKRDGVMSRML